MRFAWTPPSPLPASVVDATSKRYLEAYRRKTQALVQPAIAACEPFVPEMRADPARYAFSFDLTAAEASFTKPTLIVAGRQDTTVGYRDAWAIIEDYPRATFAVFDRAGHLLGGEQPQLWPALVDEWLDRVEEWCAGHVSAVEKGAPASTGHEA